MNPDIERFLNLRHLPDRLTATETAGKLGVSPHEIPILVWCRDVFVSKMKQQHLLCRIAQEFDQPETKIAATTCAISQPERYQCRQKCHHNQRMMRSFFR